MYIAEKIEQSLQLPIPILLIIGLNILAIVIRKSPIPNWTISICILIIATFLYPHLTTSENTVFKEANLYVLHLQGLLLGLGSLGADLLLEKVPLYRKLTKVIEHEKTPKPKPKQKRKSHAK